MFQVANSLMQGKDLNKQQWQQVYLVNIKIELYLSWEEYLEYKKKEVVSGSTSKIHAWTESWKSSMMSRGDVGRRE